MDLFASLRDEELSERTYRKAESDFYATDKTLDVIDRIFRGIRKDAAKAGDSMALDAANRWFQLREEHAHDPEPPEAVELPLPPEFPDLPEEEELPPPAVTVPTSFRDGAILAGVSFAALVLIGVVGSVLANLRWMGPSGTASEPPVVKREPERRVATIPKKTVPKPEAKPPKTPVTVAEKKTVRTETPPMPLKGDLRVEPEVVKPPPSVDKPEPVKKAEPVPFMAEFQPHETFKTTGYPVVPCAPGALLEFRVRVKNAGTEPWSRGHRPVSIGFLASHDPKDEHRIGHGPIEVEWCDGSESENTDKNRAMLRREETVLPGATREFHFKLRMPKEPGIYPLTLQMVMDGPIVAPPSIDGWFAGPVVRGAFKVLEEKP